MIVDNSVPLCAAAAAAGGVKIRSGWHGYCTFPLIILLTQLEVAHLQHDCHSNLTQTPQNAKMAGIYKSAPKILQLSHASTNLFWRERSINEIFKEQETRTETPSP